MIPLLMSTLCNRYQHNFMQPDDLSSRVSAAGTSLPPWISPFDGFFMELVVATYPSSALHALCLLMACSCQRVAYPISVSPGEQHLCRRRKKPVSAVLRCRHTISNIVCWVEYMRNGPHDYAVSATITHCTVTAKPKQYLTQSSYSGILSP